MSQSDHKTDDLVIVNNGVLSQDLTPIDMCNFSRPWGVNPVSFLEEARNQVRLNKILLLKKSLSTGVSLSSDLDQRKNNTTEIADILERLETMRTLLSKMDISDLNSSTRLGKEAMIITTQLLLLVVHQTGQANVQTPSFESIIAHIRGLIHTRSRHMRQTLPGRLLIAWYSLSRLLTFIQNEPELRFTLKKTDQLLNTALETAAWAIQHLQMERQSDTDISENERSSLPYTYE